MNNLLLADTLILKYKKKIQDLQNKREYYKNTDRAGAGMIITAEINVYNGVISDIKRLTESKK